MSSRATPPRRRMIGSSRSRRRRSIPGRQPSHRHRGPSPRGCPGSASTRAAVRADVADRLALGAAIGRSTARSRACAMAWLGTRTAMVSSPAVARSATGQSGCLASTRDSAPGQNANASRRPRSGRRPSFSAAPTSGTCTISGLNRGRSLAAKMAATARPLVASAPSPYTVSVGNATRAPPRIAAAAADCFLVGFHDGHCCRSGVAPFPVALFGLICR